MNARWIRLGDLVAEGFDAACTHLAAAQPAGAAPILAWARSKGCYLFSIVAPRLRAPGRSSRWLAWGLAPAVAAYRKLGLPAYFDGAGICLHGERIASAAVTAIGECVVVSSSFLAHFPGARLAIPSPTLEEAFRLRLEAQHGWQFDHSWPTARERVDYAHA